MAGYRVGKSLYGSLLRLAAKFDKNRPAKFMIYRPVISDKDFQSSSTLYFAAIVDKILKKSTFYPPSNIDMSFKELVRSEFRESSIKLSHIDRINTAFAVLRKFSTIWAQFESTTLSSSVKKNDKDDKFSIASTSGIQRGVMLCAHPMVSGPMQRAVVLLLEHNDEYSYGIIINKKTDHTLATATRNLPDDILAAFGDCAVSFGGNVRRLQFLHPYPDCGGTEVAGGCSAPYFYSGNISKVLSKVKEDASSRDSFHFFVGTCLWRAGELREEVQEGYWLPVKGPADRVLQYSLDESKQEAYRIRCDMSTDRSFAAAFEGVDRKSDGLNTFEGPNDTWRKVLLSAGRKLAQLAVLSPFVDISNVEPVTWHYDEEEADDE